MKKIVVLLVVVLAVAGCKRGEKKADNPATVQQTATGVEVGTRLPDYAAMNLDGTKFELTARRDKVVLLNIWATWCPPCRVEIPDLQQLHEKYGARGLEIVGVSVDEGGVETVRDFVAEQKMTYPIVMDPQGNLAATLQTSVLPTSVMLDRKGTIIWKHVGAVTATDAELLAAIEKAL